MKVTVYGGGNVGTQFAVHFAEKIGICSRVVTAGLLSGDFRHCTSIFHHMW